MFHIAAQCRGIYTIIQLLTEQGAVYFPFKKTEIFLSIVTRLANSLHECRFANGIHTADIKVIIMARFDIDTGGYPAQRHAKIACCGFNLPDI
ncbi:hypothetical protein EBP74_23875, partial [Escherichia coli O2]|nr:hypothetical protein [Escherichia coli O2]